MITGKINLAKLQKAAITTGKSGQKLLVLDIDECNLFASDKGAVYLDIVLYEDKDKKYGDYSIKQSLPKEVREAEKLAGIQRPYLGNAEVYKAKETGAAQVEPEDLSNDLPF